MAQPPTVEPKMAGQRLSNSGTLMAFSEHCWRDLLKPEIIKQTVKARCLVGSEVRFCLYQTWSCACQELCDKSEILLWCDEWHFFFGNTPRDSNPWDILYLKHIAWNVQGTCIMLVCEKNIMCFQSLHPNCFTALASGKKLLRYITQWCTSA